jgi:hypothetical protein
MGSTQESKRAVGKKFVIACDGGLAFDCQSLVGNEMLTHPRNMDGTHLKSSSQTHKNHLLIVSFSLTEQ